MWKISSQHSLCLRYVLCFTEVKPPSHSDKDHKDRTASLELDRRRENGTKCRKKHNFQVCSTSLVRPCQDVTASNTPSYVLSCAWLRTHHVLCVSNTLFLRPFRSHYALTAHLPHSHCALRDLVNSSLRCPCFHSFYHWLRISWFGWWL